MTNVKKYILNKQTTKETRYPDGEIKKEVVTETTTSIKRNTEPDYIKIYTNMWCEFNEIPISLRPLMLELVMRMSYADVQDKDGGQIVSTGGYVRDTICEKLKWGESMYNQGLAGLVKSGAIRRIKRGFYQVNPHYAGRGEWAFNPRFNRGGVENIIAKFDFKNHAVETKFIHKKSNNNQNINQQVISAVPQESEEIEGQMNLDDYTEVAQ